MYYLPSTDREQHKNTMNTNAPKIGQTIVVYGVTCTIVKIHPFGTVDVEAPNGRYYRVTGLSFF